LTVVNLSGNIAADAVLLALNSKPLSCGKITVTPCSRFAAMDQGLLPFKLAKFLPGQVAASEASPNSCLLSPFSLINGGSRRLVSKRERNRQAADTCCEYSHFDMFVSLLRIEFTLFNTEAPRRLR
jgi:hypothetical protein